MDHGVQSTLTQSQRVEKHSELCHADFKDVRDICMINGILGKHKYHQILQRLALFNVWKKAVWKIA